MSTSTSASKTDGTLVESVPSSVVQSSLRNFKWTAVAAVVTFSCCMTFLVATDPDVGWVSAIVAGLCLLLLRMGFVVGLSAAMRHELSIRIPTVELKQDMLTLRYGKSVLYANVRECRFRRGPACLSRLPGCPRLHCYLSVLLIDFPRSSLPTKTALLKGARLRVAVGYTEEMRSKWERAIATAS